ncbi:hypothetical protein FOL47_003075, partial [Perkinsus chesapeaki]
MKKPSLSAAQTEVDGTESAVNTEITPEEKNFLRRVLQKHFLFASLTAEERDEVIMRMKKEGVEGGQVVFKQGDEGDCCFAIQSGTFVVSIDRQNVKTLGKTNTFGELAMLYNVKRTATVKCTRTGVLWEISGRTFKKVMKLLQGRNLTHLVKFFSDEPDFAALTDEEKQLLSSSCTVQKFEDKDQILRQGDPGDWLFIIQSGRVRSRYADGRMITLEAGSLIGGLSLINDWKHHYDSRADGRVVCLALGKSSLAKLTPAIKSSLGRATKKVLLKNLSFYDQLDAAQQNCLLDVMEEKTYAEKDVIVSPDEGLDEARVFILLNGFVQVERMVESDTRSPRG